MFRKKKKYLSQMAMAKKINANLGDSQNFPKHARQKTLSLMHVIHWGQCLGNIHYIYFFPIHLQQSLRTVHINQQCYNFLTHCSTITASERIVNKLNIIPFIFVKYSCGILQRHYEVQVAPHFFRKTHVQVERSRQHKSVAYKLIGKIICERK